MSCLHLISTSCSDLPLYSSISQESFVIHLLPMDPQQSSSPAAPQKKVRRGRTSGTYKGVRMRAWGKWVSEIRVPKTGQRIWLGSYDAPEKAARAYDAAQYCIRGDSGQFNFPADRRPDLPEGPIDSLSKKDIKAIAFNFASSDASVPSSLPSTATTPVQVDAPSLPNLPVSSGAGTAGDVEGYIPPKATEAASSSIENLQLDDFLMLDIEWIDSL